MSKLIILKGLPASGKSTWAKKWVDEKPAERIRVNRDDIRNMLGPYFIQPREELVTEIENDIILDGLGNGYNVVVDATNFRGSDRFRELLVSSMFPPTEVEEKYFETPLEECIRRDSFRGKSRGHVGAKVIFRMYKKYIDHKAEWNPAWDVKYDHRGYVSHYGEGASILPECIITDLDGTLSLMNGRSPYRGEDCASDKVNTPVWRLLHDYYMNGMQIIIFSGRNGESRPQTQSWLEAHGVHYHALHMRREGDQRPDHVIKNEMFNDHIKGRFKPIFVLDDRNVMVDHWRGVGIPCFQVWYGDF